MAQDDEHITSVTRQRQAGTNERNGPQNDHLTGTGTDTLKAELEAIEEVAKKTFNRIVITIHDFCIFLCDLCFSDDVILVPPEGGWQEITQKSFSRFGKNDEVVEVLRHLTSIDASLHSEKYEFPYMNCTD